MKKMVWLSYDLGVKGDYESLYSWLDNHGAKECGDGVAVLNYEFKSDPTEDLKRDLEKSVDFAKRDRIYVVLLEERKERKIKGRFLIGSRKAAPWAGYGSHESVVDEEA
jgi:hypothetical protein